LTDWRIVAEPAEWWGIASGVSWMREFRAGHDPVLLSKVRDRFDELSADFRGGDGRLYLPVAALLAQGQA
jgi:hypothetical protein